MIYIPIIIIIIILIIDFYFTYPHRLHLLNEKFTDNNDDENIIKDNNITHEPWNKIDTLSNNINKYIDKIVIWKQLPFIKNDMIDIDIEDNFLIIKTSTEAEALVITNLLISYINNDITLEEILSKNMINVSIKKAKKIKLVSIKLIELIKEGIDKLNSVPYIEENEEIDTTESYKNPIVNTVPPQMVLQNITLEKSIPEIIKSNIVPYEGSEYATIRF